MKMINYVKKRQQKQLFDDVSTLIDSEEITIKMTIKPPIDHR